MQNRWSVAECWSVNLENPHSERKTLGPGLRRDDGAVGDTAYNAILAGPALNAGQLSEKKKSPFRKKTLGQGFRRDDGAVADSAYAVIPVRARIQA